MSDLHATSGPTITFDIRQVLTFITFLSVMASAVGYVLQLRNDVRANTLEIVAVKAQVEALRAGAEEVQRAKLLYCAGRRNDTASTVPDIGC
jgi:hypothetical protein